MKLCVELDAKQSLDLRMDKMHISRGEEERKKMKALQVKAKIQTQLDAKEKDFLESHTGKECKRLTEEDKEVTEKIEALENEIDRMKSELEKADFAEQSNMQPIRQLELEMEEGLKLTEIQKAKKVTLEKECADLTKNLDENTSGFLKNMRQSETSETGMWLELIKPVLPVATDEEKVEAQPKSDGFLSTLDILQPSAFWKRKKRNLDVNVDSAGTEMKVSGTNIGMISGPSNITSKTPVELPKIANPVVTEQECDVMPVPRTSPSTLSSDDKQKISSAVDSSSMSFDFPTRFSQEKQKNSSQKSDKSTSSSEEKSSQKSTVSLSQEKQMQEGKFELSCKKKIEEPPVEKPPVSPILEVPEISPQHSTEHLDSELNFNMDMEFGDIGNDEDCNLDDAQSETSDFFGDKEKKSDNSFFF
ncbi:uncharacterized protein LOC132255897 isoform X2 [Phlebotomus argentipes]|nr:uncharacterized protein LOC132255897 isoform X2 [Phlebotomus argentipes]